MRSNGRGQRTTARLRALRVNSVCRYHQSEQYSDCPLEHRALLDDAAHVYLT